jgi:uncharacterized protein YukE
MPNLTRYVDRHLLAFEREFGQLAERTRVAQSALLQQASVLQHAGWVGASADAFAAELNGVVLPQLVRLAEALESGATVTREIHDTLTRTDSAAAHLLGVGGQAWPISGGTVFLPMLLRSDARSEYTALALMRAGIDDRQWNPAHGVGENVNTIARVYDYYGNLYLNHPEFQWAGMARYTGLRLFYPAFMQITVLKQLLNSVSGRTRLSDWFPGLFVPDRDLQEQAQAMAEDVGYLETKLLEMQRSIFMDIAPQHEAYLRDGIAGIERLARDGAITPLDAQAWRDIASGVPTLVEAGNKALLRREQETVLQSHYTQIEQYIGRGISGPGLSLVLSALATAPMDANVNHFWLTVPNGRITNLDARWSWTGGPMHTEWVRLHRDEYANTRAEIGLPIDGMVNSRVNAQTGTIAYLPSYLPGLAVPTEQARAAWADYVNVNRPRRDGGDLT